MKDDLMLCMFCDIAWEVKKMLLITIKEEEVLKTKGCCPKCQEKYKSPDL
jgi:hypothetical protein